MVKKNIVLGNVANVQEFNRICGHMDFDVDLAPVSYTHLTLPTIA